jgi:hypothetical protein
MKDVREKVVDDMVLDNAVEDVAADEAKLAVDGRHGTLDERPVVRIVMRRLLVGVVQVRDGDWLR